MEERGKIIQLERFKQTIVFHGMKFDTITPTDMDALIEYKNRLYVFMEVKMVNKQVPTGQKIALKRLADDIHDKPAFVMIGEHNVFDVTKPINLATCQLREYYFNKTGRWNKAKKPITIRESVEILMEIVRR